MDESLKDEKLVDYGDSKAVAVLRLSLLERVA